MKNPARPSQSNVTPSNGSKKPQKQLPIKPWEEPVEIAKTALEQVGARPPQETQPTAGQQAAGQQGSKQPEPSPEEKRRASRMQAFRGELKEIERLQRERQHEMRMRWQQQERVKEQREEEARKAKGNVLTEPVTKAKRGVLGGMGRMFGIGKKQRQVEIAKTPTN